MNNTNFELRGESNNPYHFSVGAVVRKDDKIAIIYKKGEYYTLLTETAYANETVLDCLHRGASEELGVTVEVIRFIGGEITHFDLSDGTDIEKTSIYFEVKVVSENGKKNLEGDELNDKVMWVSHEEACRLLEGGVRKELEILKRIENM